MLGEKNYVCYFNEKDVSKNKAVSIVNNKFFDMAFADLERILTNEGVKDLESQKELMYKVYLNGFKRGVTHSNVGEEYITITLSKCLVRFKNNI